MKKRGDISQDYIYRDRVVLPELIRQARNIVEYPTTEEKIYQTAANLPTKRFYMSDDSATALIRSHIQNGIRPRFISLYKQRLYDALYEEVTRMLSESRYQGMSIGEVTTIALTHPAPCIGLTPKVIMRITVRNRKRHAKV